MGDTFNKIKDSLGNNESSAGKNVEDKVKDHSQNYGGTAGGAEESKLDEGNTNKDKIIDQAKKTYEEYSNSK
jgi:hypothetical protein